MIKYVTGNSKTTFHTLSVLAKNSKAKQYGYQNYPHILRPGTRLLNVGHPKMQNLSTASISSSICRRGQRIRGEGQKWSGGKVSLDRVVHVLGVPFLPPGEAEGSTPPHPKPREENHSKSFRCFLWKLEDSRSGI